MLRTIVTALVVAGACYLGASFGTWLRFPEVGSALLFPSYAVVVAVLWKSPPRRWWLYLIAASVGNYIAHRHDGASISFVLLAELVNHARALIAAIGLRRCAGQVRTLREIVAYLVIAALLAPCIAGLSGAALVTGSGLSSDFVMAWEQWSLSNTITALTVLPLFTVDLRRLSRESPRRLIEGAMLIGSMIAAGYLAESHLDPAHMYWATPFLLWTTVRFGWRMTSACLLATMLLAIDRAVTSDDLVELIVFLISASTPLFLLAVLLDQLSDSRRQYRSIVEDQTDLICRFRPDGTYTFANRAYTDAVGPSGSCVWDVHGPKSELEALTPETPIATHEVKIANRWVLWHERALFDEHGVATEYQVVGRDITDRKRAEDELREALARRRVEAVLRENDRRKDEFLAMLGHELRNPLGTMSLAIELLATAPPSNEGQWACQSLERQLERLTRLVDDLLDLSRVTLGKIQLQLRSLNFNEVIASVVDEMRPMIATSGHTLTVNVPDQPAWVLGDGVRLAQVVTNLVVNAVKYTERGGHIVVTVEIDDAVHLSVRDDGIGLDPNAIEMIFELFSQTPAARERGQGGLGIGLTLVRRLVELHGGSVVARSDGPNRGSEFVVTLPFTPPVAALPVETTIGSLPPPVSLRILAVDDNVDLAKGLAVVLGMWGHSVRTAHDGASALAEAAAFEPDVVLLDIGLPVIDGFEVARRLRRAERTPALLVAISGFGEAHVRQGAAEAGFHDHLIKPVDLERLRAVLGTVEPEPVVY